MRSDGEPTTALIVLGFLSEGPLHGYEMRQRFEERGIPRFTRLTPGALYAALKSLDSRGLIVAATSERVGARPERTIYRITDAGREALRSGLVQALTGLERQYSSLDAALSQAMSLPHDDVVAALVERRRRQADLVEELTAQEPIIQSGIRSRRQAEVALRMAMIRRAIAHARAELTWLDATLTELGRASKPRAKS